MITTFNFETIPGVGYHQDKHGGLIIKLHKDDIGKLRQRFLQAAQQLAELEVSVNTKPQPVVMQVMPVIPVVVPTFAPISPIVPQAMEPTTIIRGGFEPDDGNLGLPPATIR